MATEDARKLFVAGLPDSVTEEVLRGLFSETGAQVTELTLPRDRTTGRPRGFAFVRLGSTDEAERARQELDGRIVDGKMISVRPFQAEPPAGRAAMGPREGGGMDRPPRREGGFGPGPGPGAGPGGPPGGGGGFGGGGGGPGGAPDRTLYVGNLPYDATQEEIETLLRECGTEPVVRVYLPLDQDGRKRGFGFVTLGSAEVATAAIDQLKNAELRGRRLIINIAHPKGARPEGASSGPPGGFADRPRSFGGPPGGGFSGPPGGGPGFGGPPAPGGPPTARTGKGEGRKRKFDGPGGEGGGEKAAAGGKKREKEERWRDQEDDDW